VTADTRRYAGVVSADTILDKVKDVRVSIAESISIREAEAAREQELLDEQDAEYEPVGEPESDYELEDESEYDTEYESELADESEDEIAEAYGPPLDEPAPRIDTAADEASMEGPRADQPHRDGEARGNDDRAMFMEREANGEARYRRGSGILQ
jgi:osmoprotectant transport system ATP-binding protein